jgi:hypothetical protein
VDEELRKQLQAGRERTARLVEETQRLSEQTRRILDLTRNKQHAVFLRRALYEIERIKAKSREAPDR